MRIQNQVPYLRVADMARSLAFYVDGLGFDVVTKMDDEGGPFWARLAKDEAAIMISNRPSRFLDFVPHDPGHFHDHEEGHEHFHGIDTVHDGSLNFVTYVYIDDADTAYEELRARGVEPLDAPEDKFYGVREFLVRDPDGYYYAFAQLLN